MHPIKITNFTQVISDYKELAKTKRILLILDIDGVTLSTQKNKVLVDETIKELIQISYENGLLFLTARNYATRESTLNQLNSAKLIDTNEFIKYDIIFSPKKGENAIDYLNKNAYDVTMFIDDYEPNCIDMIEKHAQCNRECIVYHVVDK